MNIMILNIDFDTKMSDLIISNQQLLYMLDRFGIPLGFKDSSIAELAEMYNIDKNALLAVTQIIINRASHSDICTKDSLLDLLVFLENSHSSFREKIKSIEKHINKFSEDISGKYEILLNSFFNEYSEDIEEHFAYEESYVFPYIRKLCDINYNNKNIIISKISEFESNHTDTELKLKDLKNILIKYIPSNIKSKYRNKILYRLYDLEPDMCLHAEIENMILIPVVKVLEKDI